MAEAKVQPETPAEMLSRRLRESNQEAAKKGWCARCLGNCGRQIETKDGFCPNCGCKLNASNKF